MVREEDEKKIIVKEQVVEGVTLRSNNIKHSNMPVFFFRALLINPDALLCHANTGSLFPMFIFGPGAEHLLASPVLCDNNAKFV